MQSASIDIVGSFETMARSVVQKRGLAGRLSFDSLSVSIMLVSLALVRHRSLEIRFLLSTPTTTTTTTALLEFRWWLVQRKTHTFYD